MKAMMKKGNGITIKDNFHFADLSRFLTHVAVIMVLIVGAVAPAAAQSIVLKPDDILPHLKRDFSGKQLMYLNGTRTYWDPEPTDDLGLVGGFEKTILALLTLRLVDAGAIELTTPLSDLVPDIVPEDPFKAAILIRHLLQETAGFASPPMSLVPKPLAGSLDQRLLRRFAIIQRSPNQVSSHDPVGWAVLITALETAARQPLADLLDHHILAPLGLDGAPIQLDHLSLAGQTMPVHISLPPGSLAEIARLFIRNRDADDQPFLRLSTYQNLVQGIDGHRLHPDDRIASYGVEIRQNGSHRWLEPLNRGCTGAADFMMFPAEGSVFGLFEPEGRCPLHRLRSNVLEIAGRHFPGKKEQAADGPSLARPSKLEGRYILADRSPVPLSERLDIMQADSLIIFGYSGDDLRARRRDGPAKLYLQRDAYFFEENDNTDNVMLFSPFRLGGYIQVGDRLYRRADILGATGPLKALIPWAILVVATAGYYARRPMNSTWRKMGLFAFAGAALVGTGLYLEMTAWATVLYELGQPWLITLWRTGLNIGLMLVLSLPMFVLSFARRKTIPTSGAAFLTAPHLVAVAVSALAIFFTLVFWGVAGTFAPY